jgi:Ca2+-binding RTX toxin-like protein
MLRTAALALTLAACALLPATAGAATLTLDDAGTLHYTAADGEENHLSMWVIDVGYGMVKDDGVPGLTGCGTINAMPGWRACPNGRRPQVSLGDGDDEASLQDGGSEEMEWIGPSHVDAGSGDDDVFTGYSADVLLGGAGNDRLRPQLGANRLEGGEGNDTLESFYGDDTKIGGPGADTYLGHDGNETIDAVDGAPTDTITCHGGTDSVRADEGDTVGAGCESVVRVALPKTGTDPSTNGPTRGTDPVTNGDDAPVHPAIGPNQPQPQPQPGPAPQPAADRTAPKLMVKVKRKRGRRIVTVRSDEPVTLTIGRRTKRLTPAKALRLTLRGRKAVRLVARDAAGNQTIKRVR